MAGPEYGSRNYESPDIILDSPESGSDFDKDKLESAVKESLRTLGEESLDELTNEDINRVINQTIINELFGGVPPKISSGSDSEEFQKFRDAQAFLQETIVDLKEYGLNAVTFEVNEAFWDGRLTALQESKSYYIKPDKGFTYTLEDGTEQTIMLDEAIFEDFTPLRNKIMEQRVTLDGFTEATSSRISSEEAQRLWNYIMNGSQPDGSINVKDMQTIASKLDDELDRTLKENNGIDNAYGGWTTETMRKINLDSYIQSGGSGESEETISMTTPEEKEEEITALKEIPSNPNDYKEVVFFVDKSSSFEGTREAAQANVLNLIDSYTTNGAKIGYVPFRDFEQDFSVDHGDVNSAIIQLGDISQQRNAVKEAVLSEDLYTDEKEQAKAVNGRIEAKESLKERESVVRSMLLAIDNMPMGDADTPKLFVAYFDEPDACSYTEFRTLQQKAQEKNITIEIRYKDKEAPNAPTYNINVNNVSPKMLVLSQKPSTWYRTLQGEEKGIYQDEFTGYRKHLEIDWKAIAEMSSNELRINKYAKRRFKIDPQYPNGAYQDIAQNKFIDNKLSELDNLE